MKSDMISTKMPVKASTTPPADDNSDAESSDMPNDNDSATEEAQEIMDGIGDNHELCKALYEMLKAKYEGPDAENSEAEGEDYTMSEDGKP